MKSMALKGGQSPAAQKEKRAPEEAISLLPQSILDGIQDINETSPEHWEMFLDFLLKYEGEISVDPKGYYPYGVYHSPSEWSWNDSDGYEAHTITLVCACNFRRSMMLLHTLVEYEGKKRWVEFYPLPRK